MDLQQIIMKRFLRKLLNLNIWGARHTELKNLQKSLPDHLRGSKEAKEAIKELIEKELFSNGLRMPTTDYLLHSNSYFSSEYKSAIHQKTS